MTIDAHEIEYLYREKRISKKEYEALLRSPVVRKKNRIHTPRFMTIEGNEVKPVLTFYNIGKDHTSEAMNELKTEFIFLCRKIYEKHYTQNNKQEKEQ